MITSKQPFRTALYLSLLSLGTYSCSDSESGQDGASDNALVAGSGGSSGGGAAGSAGAGASSIGTGATTGANGGAAGGSAGSGSGGQGPADSTLGMGGAGGSGAGGNMTGVAGGTGTGEGASGSENGGASGGGDTAMGGETAMGGDTAMGGETSMGGETAMGGETSMGGETAMGGAESMEEEGGQSPCPTDGPCVILPLGDSITDGLGFNGGYRVQLFQNALDAGKDITFVGNSMNGPDMVGGQPFPKNHEGHSGWTVQQIADITPEPSLEDDPNIILLHIGTNDMYQGPQGAGERLGQLIDEITGDLPDSLLVVSNIIPFPQQAGTVDSYNAEVVQVVQEKIDAGAFVIYVDQFEGFPTSELGDGVHPNQAGYSRMADKWWEAIEPYLP